MEKKKIKKLPHCKFVVSDLKGLLSKYFLHSPLVIGQHLLDCGYETIK